MTEYLATEAGSDTLNLYDTSALAMGDLIRAIARRPAPRSRASRSRTLRDGMQAQLDRAVARAQQDPFGSGVTSSDFDAVAHTFGLIATARLYRLLTDDDQYDAFVAAQRDWVFGANPWGASFMIGAGSRFPLCPQHVVANLSGTQDGAEPILRGAVVNGPNSADLFADGLDEFFAEGHACPVDGKDRLRGLHRPRQPVRGRRQRLADRRAGARLQRHRGVRAGPHQVGRRTQARETRPISSGSQR